MLFVSAPVFSIFFAFRPSLSLGLCLSLLLSSAFTPETSLFFFVRVYGWSIFCPHAVIYISLCCCCFEFKFSNQNSLMRILFCVIIIGSEMLILESRAMICILLAHLNMVVCVHSTWNAHTTHVRMLCTCQPNCREKRRIETHLIELHWLIDWLTCNTNLSQSLRFNFLLPFIRDA